MATPPTFVAEYEVASWDTSKASATAASVAVETGDVLVCACGSEDNATQISSVAGGSLTWTEQQGVEVASYTTAYIFTAVATSTTSFTVTVTASNTSFKWGFSLTVWRGSDGVGASNKANTASEAPSLSLTTQEANSAIVYLNGDWTAADGASRTWRAINSITPTAGNNRERVYFRNSANYTVYSAYWEDAGAAGAKTTGLTAPTAQKCSKVAVEVKGAAGAAVTRTPSGMYVSQGVQRAAFW